MLRKSIACHKLKDNQELERAAIRCMVTHKRVSLDRE